MMHDETLRLLILGAHPDDAEYHAGGLAAIYRQLGHTVRVVSVTDGSAGHHTHQPQELAEIRHHEAESAAGVIGAAAAVWDYRDGHLLATHELQHRIIREIRGFRPDLVLTHRTNDYHPDHRAVGQAVQDASFLVRVPLVVPDVPALQRDPVVAFMPDLFTKPNPLAADVVIDITVQLDTIVSMLACHRSQMFEWLPWLEGVLHQVPGGEKERLTWLRQWYIDKIRVRADRYRSELVAAYGPNRGNRIECAEVYEISEYGLPLDAAARERLFSFCPCDSRPSSRAVPQ
jgi:LmbE family N-acetylglucosaminyl deacetylase